MRVWRSDLLASANFMHALSRVVAVPATIVSQALCDDFDFMTESRSLSHLASLRLRDCKEFAMSAFVNDRSQKARKRPKMVPSLYNVLSPRLQSDHEVVVYAVRSEGHQALKLIPKHLFENRELVMALLFHNCRTLKYAPAFRSDHDCVTLCLVSALQSHFQSEDLATVTSMIINQDDVVRCKNVMQRSAYVKTLSLHRLTTYDKQATYLLRTGVDID
jgi:hypothetical protein